MMTLLLLCMSSPSLVSVFKDVELSSQFGDVLRAYCKSGTYGESRNRIHVRCSGPVWFTEY